MLLVPSVGTVFPLGGLLRIDDAHSGHCDFPRWVAECYNDTFLMPYPPWVLDYTLGEFNGWCPQWALKFP